MNVWYYIGNEVEIEVNDKNEWNNGYWYGFQDIIDHATMLFKSYNI